MGVFSILYPIVGIWSDLMPTARVVIRALNAPAPPQSWGLLAAHTGVARRAPCPQLASPLLCLVTGVFFWPVWAAC